MHQILVINPGSTSTKIALFQNDKELWQESCSYSSEQLSGFSKSIDQFELRWKDIQKIIEVKKLNVKHLSSIVGRGGPFKPLKSGTYLINKHILEDVKKGRVQADHISNIGVLLAHQIASEANLPAYFVDPVSVDEFDDIARISGLPELERKSLLHALNIKATAYYISQKLGKKLANLNLVIAHLGGGISICAMRKGQIIDVNNANEGGPFSPERSGYLPVSSLVKLCYSGKYEYPELKRKLVGKGGLTAHLGTNDSREVEKRIESGDQQARAIYEAMAYQIAKEIGAMATVLKGQIDRIAITGGLARSQILMDWIQDRIAFLAQVEIIPGENEMDALAAGALRVLTGEEKALSYQ